MQNQNTSSLNILGGIAQKLSDYGMLFKVRLTALVIFSAVIAFLIASQESIQWMQIAILAMGGFFVTAAANTLNQVLERDYDKLMKRTQNRPLAMERMSVSEAVLIAGFLSLAGIMLLALFNPWAALLGTVSLILYSFIYTPMKRVSPIAVLIGAIPGALPTAIGVVAAEGTITSLALALFAIQFFWQFPHFWAIAWVGHEDYTRAGFRLLPSKSGELDQNVGLQSFIYALMLLSVAWIPYILGVTGLTSAIVLMLIGVMYAYFAWDLYKKCTKQAALKLMFCSFIYLPIALISLWVDKLI